MALPVVQANVLLKFCLSLLLPSLLIPRIASATTIATTTVLISRENRLRLALAYDLTFLNGPL